MSDQIKKAVGEYLRREGEAMKTKEGADHRALIETVAREHGIQEDVLTEAVLDASFGKVI